MLYVVMCMWGGGFKCFIYVVMYMWGGAFKCYI